MTQMPAGLQSRPDPARSATRSRDPTPMRTPLALGLSLVLLVHSPLKTHAAGPSALHLSVLRQNIAARR